MGSQTKEERIDGDNYSYAKLHYTNNSRLAYLIHKKK